MLREPLESGQIAISRANYQVTLPARFQLIAAMNPCPCGYLGDSQKPCKCTPEQVTRYQARISGPLLDRIDMHIPVRRLSIEDNTALLFKRPERRDKSTQLRELVISARNRQLERTGKKNAELSQRDLNTVCKLSQQDQQYLETAVNKWNLSARSFFRILKMARTVADLDDSITIQRQHLQEAMGFRFPVGQS